MIIRLRWGDLPTRKGFKIFLSHLKIQKTQKLKQRLNILELNIHPDTKIYIVIDSQILGKRAKKIKNRATTATFSKTLLGNLVQPNVQVRRNGYYEGQSMVPHSFEDPFLMSFYGLRRSVSSITDIKNVNNRVC